jgi:hypothetical protein
LICIAVRELGVVEGCSCRGLEPAVVDLRVAAPLESASVITKANGIENYPV